MSCIDACGDVRGILYNWLNFYMRSWYPALFEALGGSRSRQVNSWLPRNIRHTRKSNKSSQSTHLPPLQTVLLTALNCPWIVDIWIASIYELWTILSLQMSISTFYTAKMFWLVFIWNVWYQRRRQLLSFAF